MKRIARAMCLVVAVATLPNSSWATGEKASESEVAKYAALEAISPEAAAFEGGDAAGTLLFILVVAAIVVLVYFLLEEHHHAPWPRSEEAPPLFR